MKYLIRINQEGLVRANLIGRVHLPELALMDYISAWPKCKSVKKVASEQGDYVWLNAPHAIREMPLVFNPQATFQALRNQFSRILGRLRGLGLIESVIAGRDLYVRLTPLALSIVTARGRGEREAENALMLRGDDTLTLKREGYLMPPSDDRSRTIIDETITKGTEITEPVACVSQSVLSPRSESPNEKAVELIYEAYPKHVGRPSSLSAIRIAVQKHGAALVLKKTREFATTYRGSSRFIPNPKTFFADERFLDDPETWRLNGTKSGQGVPPREFHAEDYRQPVGDL